MARRYEEDQSPEDQADELIRYNKRLQRQQQRADLVDARVRFRNQALAHGIPSTWLPSVQQVKSMDDSTWNFHNQRINRLGFYGVDDMGRPLAKPAQPSPVSVATSPIRRTGGPLDDLTLNRFSTTQADARNIAAKYGSGEVKTTGTPASLSVTDPKLFVAKTPVGYDYNLGTGEYVPKSDRGAINGKPLGPSPLGGASVVKTTGAEYSKSPLDTINNPPSIASAPLPKLSTELLGVPSGQEVPPATPNAWATQNAPRIPGYATQPVTPGRDFADVVSDVFGSIKSGGKSLYAGLTTPAATSGNPIVPRPAGGDAVQAGVSNASAAQFEKPTKENPVPVTPTTPVANIDKSTESLGRFGMSDDEFNRRKFAFAGF